MLAMDVPEVELKPAAGADLPATADGADASPRSVYRAPTLTRLGEVADLTGMEGIGFHSG
jgi:hypothetical protein